MKKTLAAAATGALVLACAGPAFAERIYLACDMTNAKYGGSWVTSVILDTDRVELTTGPHLYTRAGNPLAYTKGDGSKATTILRLRSMTSDMVRFGADSGSTESTLNRVTGQIAIGDIEYGQCKRVAGPAF